LRKTDGQEIEVEEILELVIEDFGQEGNDVVLGVRDRVVSKTRCLLAVQLDTARVVTGISAAPCPHLNIVL
jgi:hypothetical protein